MSRISPPLLFSSEFGVNPVELRKRGLLDPALNIDTKLFIDPLLLPYSKYDDFSKLAWKRYEQHFEKVIIALSKAREVGDPYWIVAQKLMKFGEIKWTCLGYGAQTISGSGSGEFLSGNMLESAQKIIRFGVEDPDLFLAFALFEDGIGPDRISDMTTNVIVPEIVKFTEAMSVELEIQTKVQHISTIGAGRITAALPWNRIAKGPVLLLPQDILRALPLLADWGTISDNIENVKSDVNHHIIGIWQTKSAEAKAELKQAVLNDAKTIRWLIDTINSIDPKSYDFHIDPEYQVLWRELGERIALENARSIQPPKAYTRGELDRIVEEILETFRFLIEDRRLSEEFYLPDGKARTEKAAQRLFFAIAYSYCKSNNIDITPEAETGNGPVDFKFSTGFLGRVLVEVKLSTNSKVVAGYERQLATYAVAEETDSVVYLLIDIGSIGDKYERIVKLRNQAILAGRRVPKIMPVDGKRRPSASKL